jgi:polyphenol oxidase
VQLREPFYDLDGQIAIDLPGARAVFTTSSWGDVRETLPTIAARLGVRAVRPKQVHGDTVAMAAETDRSVEADALFTDVAGAAPTVISADCVPIVIAGCGVVAAVHAGWRGLDSGVIEKTLDKLRARTGATSAFSAAIGPAAGACCYEVGPELRLRFKSHSDGQRIDLKGIAGRQLEQAGVQAIHDAGICTICSTDPQLFSHRRQGHAAGRQALIAWLT